MQNLRISSILISLAPSKQSLSKHVIFSLFLTDETQNIIVPARDDNSFCCRIFRNIKICRGCRNQNGTVLGNNLSTVAFAAASSLLDAPSMKITQVPCRNTTQDLPCLPGVVWIILRHVSVICSLTTTMSTVGHWSASHWPKISWFTKKAHSAHFYFWLSISGIACGLRSKQSRWRPPPIWE